MISIKCDVCGSSVLTRKNSIGIIESNKITINRASRPMMSYDVCDDCIEKVEGGLCKKYDLVT